VRHGRRSHGLQPLPPHMKANCSRGRRWQTLASLCVTLRCSCGMGNRSKDSKDHEGKEQK
jgi:hypothetical protein